MNGEFIELSSSYGLRKYVEIYLGRLRNLFQHIYMLPGRNLPDDIEKICLGGSKLCLIFETLPLEP